ncbi:RAMP superfamily CRISPR-associated protein [Buchananella hordeovulneris]|uniref:RAMP superfamily CRISPR-associated protein n=1 Tax=Buchananella hordeovulneris TaxID=52770 RepID=UPI0026DCB8A9|nr:RAMP superfamily CRISPR-associated protein [Buchananella hordeovulneris]MDO5080952.1 type III-B CRISPR module-associated Cmr3 family protein [Buchananella hordeovulneris]
MTATELSLEIVFTTDWGIGTGLGRAGGVNAALKRDEDGQPFVPASTLTGAIRQQAFVVADALDEATGGGEPSGTATRPSWSQFVTGLFGSPQHARLVTFTSAHLSTLGAEAAAPTDSETMAAPFHDVVSLAIDADTGTAKNNMLRVIERAAPATLTATARLLEEDQAGNQLRWTKEQREAALLVVGLACRLVDTLGGERTGGDGRCRITPSNEEQLLSQLQQPPAAPTLPQTASWQAHLCATARQDDDLASFTLDIELCSPLVSFAVPMSNEVPTLDFLRGTALLPWVHTKLRGHCPDNALVANAVVNGELYVSDALPVVDGVRGLPLPLALTRPKTSVARGGDSSTVAFTNRLRAAAGDIPQKQVRHGYLFPAVERGAFGTPPQLGQQHISYDAVSRTAKTGHLYLARSLPAGMRLRATLHLSTRLAAELSQPLEDLLTGTAQLGSRRLTSTYGKVKVNVSALPKSPPQPDASSAAEVTLWFTSDVLVRSGSLGPCGGVEDLLAEFARRGVELKLADSPDTSAVFVRYRRIDSWSAAGQQPRASRVAIQAGSVLRLQLGDEADRDVVLPKLQRLGELGIGELGAQGFGRFVVNHSFLEQGRRELRELAADEFFTGKEADK